jgi:tetratricopeptide (TPR) repeat protein
MHNDPSEPSANDVRRTVRRFEEMLATHAAVFFDLSDFELLIDHYTGRQEYDHALRACEAALEQYPFSADLLIDKAQLLAMTSRTNEALRLIDEVAEREPENPDIAVTRGIIYSQRADFGRAVECFHEGLTQGGEERDDVQFNLALAYQHWGKPRAAARHYQEALRLNPSNESAAHELLMCWELSDELAAAPAFFQEFVDRDPYSARAWFNLGLAKLRLEETDAAHDAFEYATLIESDFHDAYGYLGQTRVLRGDYRSALEAFELSFPTGEPTAEALCNLGECHEKLTEWADAKRYYQRALEMDQTTDEAWFGLGMVLLGQERYYEALHYIRKAISLYDGTGEYWLGLARCEYQVGNVVSALEAFERATTADPASSDAWVGWASVLFEQGHYEEAADLVRTALEAQPDSADLHYRACAYLLAAGRYRAAYEYLENALLLDFEKHPVLFEYFPTLASQPTLLRLIDQYRK